MDLKARAAALKRDIPAVFLAMRRKETPISAKLFAALAVGYALSPIDLIPDVIPVLGYLDDVLLLPLLVALAVKRIPPSVLDECRRASEDLWRDGKPKHWYFAIPIAALWLGLLWLVLWLI